MSQKKQQKRKSLEDLMTKDEINRLKGREKFEREDIAPEWKMLSELGMYYGFESILAVLDDKITLVQAFELLKGARMIYNRGVYDSAIAVRAGNAGKSRDFQKIMSHYMKGMK